MAKYIDVTGKKFGRLTAIKRVGTKRRCVVWECKCDCGNTVEVSIMHLRNGDTKSCGCLRKECFNANQVESTNIGIINSSKLSINNKSGYKGVYYDEKRGKWIAQINFKKKHYGLGQYDNKEDAIKARKEAEEKYFKPLLESIDK